MEDAGTVDLRGQEALPLLLEVLGATAPGGLDARVQDMRDRLAAWNAASTHRRDFDHSGEYDDPQSPAIMDAWWTRLAHAMFDSASGNALGALHIGLRRHARGSSRLGLQRRLLQSGQQGPASGAGKPVQDPWSRTYCGNGNLAACKTALWGALEQAAADLETAFGSPNVADWKRAIADDDVRHRRSASRRCRRSTGSIGRPSSKSCSSSPARVVPSPRPDATLPRSPRPPSCRYGT